MSLLAEANISGKDTAVESVAPTRTVNSDEAEMAAIEGFAFEKEHLVTCLGSRGEGGGGKSQKEAAAKATWTSLRMCFECVCVFIVLALLYLQIESVSRNYDLCEMSYFHDSLLSSNSDFFTPSLMRNMPSTIPVLQHVQSVQVPFCFITHK